MSDQKSKVSSRGGKDAGPDILQQIADMQMSLSAGKQALKRNGMEIKLQLGETETTPSLEGHRDSCLHMWEAQTGRGLVRLKPVWAMKKDKNSQVCYAMLVVFSAY